jgi:hypothetical protein
MRWPWECAHHLRYGQTLVERHYTGVALFECLTSKFRLLLDLDFIFRHQHGHDRYPFSFEEPENFYQSWSQSYYDSSYRLPRQARAPTQYS